MTAPVANDIRRAGMWEGGLKGRVVLDYEGRFLRRKRLALDDGGSVVVDLSQTVSLEPGDALVLEDGGHIEVAAADEPLLRVTGDLVRLAWHIGNRHTPCQVADDHLLIRDDHVLAQMLRGLGAAVESIHGAFRPEGGAYGHGRTHGHAHGPHDGHGHDHADGHDHGHGHSR